MLLPFSRNLKKASLVSINAYKLLSHKHIQQEKLKFFGEQQKTLKLKTKFFLKQMKYTLIEGFKQLKEDTKWLLSTHKSKKKHDFTGFQIAKRRRIVIDLLKFVPYSVILAIPAAQVLLPVILWLFPNAIPSFFLFDTHYDEKLRKLQKKQEESHQILLQKLVTVFKQHNLRSDCLQQYNEFKNQFFQIEQHLNMKLNYRNFHSDDLIRIKQFLGGDIYTGTATINKIVNLFTGTIPRVSYKLYRYSYYKYLQVEPPQYQDPFFVKQNFKFLQFNYGPFEYGKRAFLIWQIQRTYKRLELEDLAFNKHGLHDIKGTSIKNFARERGLAPLSCYETLKNVIHNDWVKQVADSRLQNNNLKLWYSVMLYHIISKNNRQQN